MENDPRVDELKTEVERLKRQVENLVLLADALITHGPNHKDTKFYLELVK